MLLSTLEKILNRGALVQLEERRFPKPDVVGSNPICFKGEYYVVWILWQ